ncbi:dTDP-4-amino-4,6-dideoxygalactose transaminase [compost metagenome]
MCNSIEQRSQIIEKLKLNNISAVFHYLSLHKSPFYQAKHDGRELLMTDFYSECLLRLPMYYELSDEDLKKIISIIISI